MSPNSKWSLGWVKMLVWFYRGWCYWLAKQAEDEALPKGPVICQDCGGEMRLVAITNGTGTRIWPKALPMHSVPFFDSG